MKSIDLSFIIPAKNEEGAVTTLHTQIVKEVKKLKKSYEIIFIDDGSTDNTFKKFTQIAKKDKKVKVVKLRGNWGKSVALQIGFNIAKGKIVFTMDADLQDDPKEISSFIKKINSGYDLVTGWKKKRHDPISKTIPSAVVNYLVRSMSGLKIHDTNCGFKAYKNEVVKELSLYGDLYRFIPVIVHRQNFKVAEIPVEHHPRTTGKSKYGWKRFFSGWLDLLTIFFLIRYLRRPGHFFGGIGVVLTSIGILIGLYITFLRLTTGTIQDRHPLLFLGILLMVVGVQLVSTGLLAEMMINLNQKNKNIENYIEKTYGFKK